MINNRSQIVSCHPTYHMCHTKPGCAPARCLPPGADGEQPLAGRASGAGAQWCRPVPLRARNGPGGALPALHGGAARTPVPVWAPARAQAAAPGAGCHTLLRGEFAPFLYRWTFKNWNHWNQWIIYVEFRLRLMWKLGLGLGLGSFRSATWCASVKRTLTTSRPRNTPA